jgi:UDP-GlcNAc:undecaprenyl-phosphate GlcNAc-1-phosphate transferase
MIIPLIIFLFLLNFFFFFNFNKIATYINIFDLPSKRKIHKKKVASIGGVFFLINFFLILLAGYLFKIKLFYFDTGNKFEYISFIFILFSFFILGIIDDKNNISYKIKFIFFFIFLYLLASIDNKFVINNLNFSFLETGILVKYPVFFTIFCTLLFINAFNMIDGINLLSSSYFFFILVFFILNNCISIFFLLLIFFYIFFLYLNYKNKIFLGDNGTIPISFLISYIFIKSYNSSIILNADIIFIIMSIPGLDMFRLFIERIFNKKNPFKPDNNHLHHLVLFLLYGNRNVASITVLIFLFLPLFLTFAKFSNLIIILSTIAIYIITIIFIKIKIK